MCPLFVGGWLCIGTSSHHQHKSRRRHRVLGILLICLCRFQSLIGSDESIVFLADEEEVGIGELMSQGSTYIMYFSASHAAVESKDMVKQT